MNRRDFTLRLGALFASPAIPAQAITQAVSAVPVGAYEHFKVAKLVARAHNNCSPSFLMRHLKVDAEMAKHVETILIERNVITMPDLKGISKAVNPMNMHTIHHEALKPVHLPTQKSDMLEKAKDVLEDVETELEQELSSSESTDPQDEQAKTDDGVPTRHTDPE